MQLRLLRSNSRPEALMLAVVTVSVALLQSCSAPISAVGTFSSPPTKNKGGVIGEWTRFDGPSRSCAKADDFYREITIGVNKDRTVSYQRVVCSGRSLGAYEEVDGEGHYRLSGNRIIFFSNVPGYFSAFAKSPTTCTYRLTPEDRLILSNCEGISEDWVFDRFEKVHQLVSPADLERKK